MSEYFLSGVSADKRPFSAINVLSKNNYSVCIRQVAQLLITKSRPHGTVWNNHADDGYSRQGNFCASLEKLENTDIHRTPYSMFLVYMPGDTAPTSK